MRELALKETAQVTGGSMPYSEYGYSEWEHDQNTDLDQGNDTGGYTGIGYIGAGAGGDEGGDGSSGGFWGNIGDAVRGIGDMAGGAVSDALSVIAEAIENEDEDIVMTVDGDTLSIDCPHGTYPSIVFSSDGALVYGQGGFPVYNCQPF